MTAAVDQRPTIEETTDSLTGYDEIAIAKHFGDGKPWTDLAESDPLMFARSLIFVVFSREDGVKVADAKDRAMKLRVKDVQEFFADDDEVTPDEPQTEAGKDSEPHD